MAVKKELKLDLVALGCKFSSLVKKYNLANTRCPSSLLLFAFGRVDANRAFIPHLEISLNSIQVFGRFLIFGFGRKIRELRVDCQVEFLDNVM